MDDLQSGVLAAIEAETKQTAATVFAGLIEQQPSGIVPERIFRDYFLPCFVGNRTDRPNWVTEWISVAGSPSSELTVVSDTDKSVVLFKVPPLLHSGSVVSVSGEEDLSNIFKRFAQLNANLPGTGTEYLFKALSRKNGELTANLNSEDVGSRWLAILSRYNLIKETESTTSESKEDDLTDSFDF